ncbi:MULTISPECIES: hypothetical protein [Rhizobium]|uniref:hypothetical protein n=1 Tax=Rhizobium TaxID=379 RepID=UPI0007EBD235|nr:MULTISPECIES: hypothetical protein [Rhizobium]ANK91767.1 hypothetical protein AMK01_CH02310 [Rhizobium sp. N6212]ANK97801.1 hypothetical protein AMK00_CH02313 [Rhizobium sp. N621]ANL03880.1 hypothetical protein AMJ99_CH02340 [Rhizobium esperanzae]ANL09926.1 hypothetical protein AMJ98_CH02262 [Rhizobium sp. N1341]ANL21978.1 hypothetical protein AMJ96_CH02269 [Rhizobium sp. N113]
MSQAAQSAPDEQPLLSTRFLLRTMVAISVLAVLTVAISIAGRSFGRHISLAGNTDSTAEITLTIGRDTVKFPENTIRFPSQRHDGGTERVDLYLAWPSMQGYGKDNHLRFDDVAQSSGLIFLQIAQSTMSRDMSGRLEPIYSHLIEGTAEPFRDGLTLHRLRADAGYGGEVLLTAPVKGGPDYVVRCILPSTPDKAASGDCQRDIKVGKDLSVLYRFSSSHLVDWEHIDAAIRLFVEPRLVNRSVTGP